MLKRKTLLFLAILLVVAAQFGARKAMAFSDYCEEPAMSGSQEGWTVTLAEPVEVSPGSWRWTYTIQNNKGTASGLNFAAMLIPDCCTDPKIEVNTSTGFTKYFAVEEGEPTLKFGMYNAQARVLKGTAANNTEWSFITNTNVKTTSTILLKVHKIGALTFEMAVPGCNPKTDPITQSSEKFTYVNDEGQEYNVIVTKDQYGKILSIIRTIPDCEEGDECDENITDDGIPVNEILARFPDPSGGEVKITELFNFVPNDTVTKSGEDSTCGYWYRGVFWNFCY